MSVKRSLHKLALITPLLLAMMLVFTNVVMAEDPTWPKLTGTAVFPPDGIPVGPGAAFVEAVSEPNSRYGTPTIQNGVFAFGVPPNNTYDLQALPQGPLSWEYTPSIPQEFDVEATGIYQTGPLTLTYPSASGPVLTPDGDLFGDCIGVWLSVDEDGDERVMHYPYCGSDHDTYMLGGVPEGVYWLHAGIAPGFGFIAPDPIEVIVAPDSQYDIDATQWITIQLGMGELITPQLTVEVLDPDGSSIPGRVHVWNRNEIDEWRVSMPDAPARFAGLPPADYQVQAWPTGSDIPALANSEKMGLWVEETTEEDLEVSLLTPNVTGVVEAPGGHPLPPAYDWEGLLTPPALVMLHDMDWTFELIGPTNITGEFSLATPVHHSAPHAPSQPSEGNAFVLLAEPRESLHEQFTKSMPRIFTPNELPYENVFLWLTFPRIQGVVVGPDDVCLVSTSVDLWSADWNYQDWSETEAGRCDGTFQILKPFKFGGMPAGMYSVQGGPPYDDLMAGKSDIYDFDVVPGSQYWITATEWITLYIGGNAANVMGEVVFPNDGPPVPWADVVVRWPNPADPDWPFFEEWTQANARGQFAFYGLQAGAYEIQSLPPEHLRGDWEPSEWQAFALSSAEDLFTTTLELRPAFRPKLITGTVMYGDDSPLANVMVYAFMPETGARVEVWADENGYYELPLRGGLWFVGVENHPGADWFFDPEGEVPVEFGHTSDEETAWIDLYVEIYDNMEDFAQVTGAVKTPADANAPDGTWVEICSDATGECFGGETQSGTFDFWAPMDCYFLSIYPDPDSGFLPPADNGEIGVEIWDNPTALGLFTLREKIPATVQGRVTAAGNGIRNVPIEAWTEDGDFAMVKTDANGYYTLTLSPGFWSGGPVLTGTLAQEYVVLPPQRRRGTLTLAGATDQDFRLSKLNATIQGRVLDVKDSKIITEVNAVVFVETCNDNGCVGTEADVYEGTYSVRVIGGYTYTVDIWAERYMPGPNVPVEVYVETGASATANLGLLEAGIYIWGELLDSGAGPDDPPLPPLVAEVNGSAPSDAYGIADNWFWVSDSLWPEKNPYRYNLYVPAPISPTVTWDLGLWVNPQREYSGTHYIADPAIPHKLTLTADDTIKHVDLHVKKLDTFITGTLSLPRGTLAPHIPVFAIPTTISESVGLVFEATTNSIGEFKIPVLPDEEYEVGAFLPPKFKDRGFLPPIPQPWNGVEGNPVTLVFRHLPRPDEGGLTISGQLSVDPTTALTVGTSVNVIGWAAGGATSAVTGTIGSLYYLPVISDTAWHVWAVHEGDDLYYSQEEIVQVGVTSVLSQDLTLEYISNMPDEACWSVTPNGDILSLPRQGALLPPVLWVKPGTFEETVEICAEPTAQVPDGVRLVGFAYELIARNNQGRALGEDDFKQTMRLSYYYSDDILANLPIDTGYNDPAPSNLTPAYFSTIKNEWVPLTDPMVDEADQFVTGKLGHFTAFGLMATTPAKETAGGYSIYLPLVLKQQ